MIATTQQDRIREIVRRELSDKFRNKIEHSIEMRNGVLRVKTIFEMKVVLKRLIPEAKYYRKGNNIIALF